MLYTGRANNWYGSKGKTFFVELHNWHCERWWLSRADISQVWLIGLTMNMKYTGILCWYTVDVEKLQSFLYLFWLLVKEATVNLQDRITTQVLQKVQESIIRDVVP